MTERDPRIDPRPGDVIMGRNQPRVVTHVELGEPSVVFGYRARYVTYLRGNGKKGRTCWIATWQEWCQRYRAIVVETGKS